MTSEREVPFTSKPPAGWHDHVEAMRATRMFLLQMMGPTRFVVRGEDSDRKFTVLVGSRQRCSCGVSLCAHHLFVMIKVLKVPQTNPLAWQTALIDSEVDCILSGIGNASGCRETAAGSGVTRREYLRRGSGRTSAGGGISGGRNDPGGEGGEGRQGDKCRLNIVPGEVCPVCQEEMEEHDEDKVPPNMGLGRLTFCREGCGNNMHARCMLMYAEHRRSSGEKPCCPLCRTEWGPGSIRALKMEQWEKSGKGKKGFQDQRSNGKGSKKRPLPITCRSCKVKVQAVFFRCLVCTPAGFWDLCRRCYAGASASRIKDSCVTVGRRRHPFLQGDAASDPPDWKPAEPPARRRQGGIAAGTEIGGNRHTAPGVLSLQGREITTADFEVLLTLDAPARRPLHEHLLQALPLQQSPDGREQGVTDSFVAGSVPSRMNSFAADLVQSTTGGGLRSTGIRVKSSVGETISSPALPEVGIYGSTRTITTTTTGTTTGTAPLILGIANPQTVPACCCCTAEEGLGRGHTSAGGAGNDEGGQRLGGNAEGNDYTRVNGNNNVSIIGNYRAASTDAADSAQRLRRLPCGHHAHDACLISIILEGVGVGDPGRCTCPRDGIALFPTLRRHRLRTTDVEGSNSDSQPNSEGGILHASVLPNGPAAELPLHAAGRSALRIQGETASDVSTAASTRRNKATPKNGDLLRNNVRHTGRSGGSIDVDSPSETNMVGMMLFGSGVATTLSPTTLIALDHTTDVHAGNTFDRMERVANSMETMNQAIAGTVIPRERVGTITSRSRLSLRQGKLVRENCTSRTASAPEARRSARDGRSPANDAGQLSSGGIIGTRDSADVKDRPGGILGVFVATSAERHESMSSGSISRQCSAGSLRRSRVVGRRHRASYPVRSLLGSGNGGIGVIENVRAGGAATTVGSNTDDKQMAEGLPVEAVTSEDSVVSIGDAAAEGRLSLSLTSFRLNGTVNGSGNRRRGGIVTKIAKSTKNEKRTAPFRAAPISGSRRVGMTAPASGEAVGETQPGVIAHVPTGSDTNIRETGERGQPRVSCAAEDNHYKSADFNGLAKLGNQRPIVVPTGTMPAMSPSGNDSGSGETLFGDVLGD